MIHLGLEGSGTDLFYVTEIFSKAVKLVTMINFFLQAVNETEIGGTGAIGTMLINEDAAER